MHIRYIYITWSHDKKDQTGNHNIFLLEVHDEDEEDDNDDNDDTWTK